MLIDLTLKICPHLIQNSCIIETGLSDFHKIVVTVMKTTGKFNPESFITVITNF